MSKVSVIVPVYNAEKYLVKCVDSILAQTYHNLEVLLVDDGSPDNCPAICDGYVEKDSRIRVIHKENGGVASARNAGLDAATGDYVTFVDSDDYIESQMYEMMIENALRYDCDVVMCDCVKEYDDKAVLYTHNIRSGYYDRTQLEQEHFKHLLIMENVEYPATISNWLLLFKNNRDRRIRYLNGVRYSEDLLFGAQLLYHAQSFFYMKGEALYHYRMNPQSATHKFVSDKWNDYQRLHCEISRYFGNRVDQNFNKQVDLCLLFFMYNSVGDIMRTNQLTHRQKVEKIWEILQTQSVKEMFSRLQISKLQISSKQKVITWLYKKQYLIGLLCTYFG